MAAALMIYEIIVQIFRVLKLLCSAVGGIYIATGVIKYAMAHANEDGPGVHKATMMLATGVVLLVMAATILDANTAQMVANWISGTSGGFA